MPWWWICYGGEYLLCGVSCLTSCARGEAVGSGEPLAHSCAILRLPRQNLLQDLLRVVAGFLHCGRDLVLDILEVGFTSCDITEEHVVSVVDVRLGTLQQ